MSGGVRHGWSLLAACGLMLPGSAAADDDRPPASGGRDAGAYVFIGALAVNAGLTIYDLATLGEDKPAIYGFAETVVAVPQALVLGSLALLADDSDGAWIPTTLALWTAALAAHGIYTLASGRSGGGEDAARSARAVILSFGGAF